MYVYLIHWYRSDSQYIKSMPLYHPCLSHRSLSVDIIYVTRIRCFSFSYPQIICPFSMKCVYNFQAQPQKPTSSRNTFHNPRNLSSRSSVPYFYPITSVPFATVIRMLLLLFLSCVPNSWCACILLCSAHWVYLHRNICSTNSIIILIFSASSISI